MCCSLLILQTSQTRFLDIDWEKKAFIMSNAEMPCYTLINVPSDFETPNEMQLKADLEKGDLKIKTEALKKSIYMILNGEKIQDSPNGVDPDHDTQDISQDERTRENQWQQHKCSQAQDQTGERPGKTDKHALVSGEVATRKGRHATKTM